jgi:hypothetical protein
MDEAQPVEISRFLHGRPNVRRTLGALVDRNPSALKPGRSGAMQVDALHTEEQGSGRQDVHGQDRPQSD